MQIFDLCRRTLKPGLPPHIDILFLHRDRGRAEERPVPPVECKADQIVAVCLVEQLHLAVRIVHGKVLALNRGIVNRVRESAHIL